MHTTSTSSMTELLFCGGSLTSTGLSVNLTSGDVQ